MKYGITDTGFNIKTLPIMLGEVAADYRANIGQVNVEDDSVFSQMVRPPLSQFAEGWEALQAVYQMGTPKGARGVTLDNLIAVNFITRLAASKTTVLAAITGTLGATIPAGNRASISGTGALFEATDDGVVDQDNALRGTVTIATIVNSAVYAVTIGGVTYSTSASGSAESGVPAAKLAIAAALVSAINADADAVADAVNNLDGSFYITATDLVTPFAYSVGSVRLAISATYSPQAYQAIETGPVPALAGTLTVIENPIGGFNAITNLQDGLLGRNKETDKELLIRRLRVLARAGKATLPAIEAKLISGDVPGVTQVAVYENRTDLTDAAGRPPHSIEAVVLGGDDVAVAVALNQVRGDGINTFGNINAGAGVSILDAQGQTQIIKFSRPVPRYAWVEITYTLYNEEIFPDDGEALIRAAALKFGNDNFPMGKNFMLQRFVGPCFESVEGLARVTIRIATSTTPTGSHTYGTADLAVAATEVLIFDSTRIVLIAA